jgi:hypothetical protein
MDRMQLRDGVGDLAAQCQDEDRYRRADRLLGEC